MTTALFVTHAVMQVPAGRLCDRLGARLIGAIGLLVTAVASMGVATWHDARLAIALRAAAGAGTALSFVAGSDYARRTSGTALVQGLFGAMSLLGGGIALAVIPLFGGWRVPFLSAAAVAAVGALIVARAPADRLRLSRRPELLSSHKMSLARYAVMHSASFGLSVVVANWIVTLLERHGHPAEAAGAVGSLTLVFGVLTRLVGGRFSNRACALRASFVLGGLAVCLLAFSSSLAVTALAAALVGLATGLPFASAFSGAARARPDGPAAAVGFVNMAAALTILAATPLLGLTFGLPGDGKLGYLIVGGLWALAALSVPKNT
jgi:MFS family permease